nr:hypothetical protein [Phycisphaerae bacterium]NIX00530.1 hypothetical protein [Phycisphaerae bacterium]
MKKRLSICLFVVLLIVGCATGPILFQEKAKAQEGEIIVEYSDYIWTNTPEYSAGLINVTKNVTPRIVMEYGDSNFQLDLNKSDELNQAASAVSPRIAVEYTDFISSYSLQGSETLNQASTSVEPRIIVEYADFVFSTDLGPKPMEDITPPVIENVFQQPGQDSVYPDDEVEVFANVIDNMSGVKQVILNYTIGNGTWFTVQMTSVEGNLYSATIPQFSYCTNVTYVIIAEDNANNTITTKEMGLIYQYHVIQEFPLHIFLTLNPATISSEGQVSVNVHVTDGTSAVDNAHVQLIS